MTILFWAEAKPAESDNGVRGGGAEAGRAGPGGRAPCGLFSRAGAPPRRAHVRP